MTFINKLMPNIANTLLLLLLFIIFLLFFKFFILKPLSKDQDSLKYKVFFFFYKIASSFVSGLIFCAYPLLEQLEIFFNLLPFFSKLFLPYVLNFFNWLS